MSGGGGMTPMNPYVHGASTATQGVGDLIASGGSTGAQIGGGALSGAASGALMGSVVPVVGTLVGGAVGAVGGAIGGLTKSLIGKKKEEAAKKQQEAKNKKALGQQRLRQLDQGEGLQKMYESGGPLNIRMIDANGAVGGNVSYEEGGKLDPIKNRPGVSDIKNGGTHEENPLGGVPIGNNNNFVEEGEFKYGKYVFSNKF